MMRLYYVRNLNIEVVMNTLVYAICLGIMLGIFDYLEND